MKIIGSLPFIKIDNHQNQALIFRFSIKIDSEVKKSFSD